MNTRWGLVAGIGVLACAFAANAEILGIGAVKTTTGANTAIQVVTVPAKAVTPVVSTVTVKTGILAAVPATTALSTMAAVLAADKLPPLDLSNMRLWNWAGIWHASEWDNSESPIPWRFNHVSQPSRADTFLTINALGAPQLQPEGGMAAANNGLWETEVTLPQFRDGMIVAPLWLYDTGSRDEIDFEFVGKKGLDVTLHAYVNGVHKQNTVRLFAGRDLSGQRKRFGIKVDQTAGYVEMYVDGERVNSWSRASLGFFVSRPLKPWIEMWGAKPTNAGYVQWAGKFAGFVAKDSSIMTVHGYRYKALR